MNILIISTINHAVLDNLFNYLKCFGQNVIYQTYDSDNVNKITIQRSRILKRIKMPERIPSLIFKRIKKTDCLFVPDKWNYYRITANEIIKKSNFIPDVIICSWTKYYFSTKLIYDLQIKTRALVVQLPLDMSPLTGGCHYSLGCEKYKIGCGKCPQLKSKIRKDISYRDIEYIKKYIDKMNLLLIAPSHELFQQANDSYLYKNKNITKCTFGLDPNKYHPENKKKYRIINNIPIDANIIFFGATYYMEKRKGYKYFQKAIQELEKRLDQTTMLNTYIFIVGNGNFELKTKMTIIKKDLITDYSKLIECYCISDVYACPSIYDSGPIMINEMIMSGVPVVSFGTGVSEDLSVNYKTGYIAKFEDAEDFANGLEYFIKMKQTDKAIVSKVCRKIAMERTNFNIQIPKLINQINNYIIPKK